MPIVSGSSPEATDRLVAPLLAVAPPGFVGKIYDYDGNEF
jgi:hypothetical protein